METDNRKISALSIAVQYFIGSLFVWFWPNLIIVLFVFLTVTYWISIRHFLKKYPNCLELPFFFMPFIFLMAFITTFLFVEGAGFKNLYLAGSFYVMYKLHYWLILVEKDKKALADTFKFASIIAVFLIYSLFFRLYLVFDLNILYWGILGFVLVFFMVYQVFSGLGIIDKSKSVSYSGMIALVVFQCSWILTFFPTSFYVDAGILAIIYYIYFHVFAMYLTEDKFDRKKFAVPAVLGGLSIISILVSASWI